MMKHFDNYSFKFAQIETQFKQLIVNTDNANSQVEKMKVTMQDDKKSFIKTLSDMAERLNGEMNAVADRNKTLGVKQEDQMHEQQR